MRARSERHASREPRRALCDPVERRALTAFEHGGLCGDPRLFDVGDQEIPAIELGGTTVVSVGDLQLAALVLFVAVIAISGEPVHVHDNVIEVYGRVAVYAEVRADGIEADDLRNRFTNVGKCRPQALRCQLLFTAGPKSSVSSAREARPLDFSATYLKIC